MYARITLWISFNPYLMPARQILKVMLHVIHIDRLTLIQYNYVTLLTTNTCACNTVPSSSHITQYQPIYISVMLSVSRSCNVVKPYVMSTDCLFNIIFEAFQRVFEVFYYCSLASYKKIIWPQNIPSNCTPWNCWNKQANILIVK